MLSFGASTCKFPYKTAIFAYTAIWSNPPNSFFRTWFCDFWLRRGKKELMHIARTYATGKRSLRATSTTVWKVLPATSPSRGLKNRWRCSKNVVLSRLSPFSTQVEPILGSFQVCKSQIQTIYKSMQLKNCWVHSGLYSELNLNFHWAYGELLLNWCWII